RDAGNDINQRVPIARRRAAVTIEELAGAQLADHLRGVDVGHRREVECDVTQQLHEDATETADDERTEGWVGGDTDEGFDAAAHPGGLAAAAAARPASPGGRPRLRRPGPPCPPPGRPFCPPPPARSPWHPGGSGAARRWPPLLRGWGWSARTRRA